MDTPHTKYVYFGPICPSTDFRVAVRLAAVKHGYRLYVRDRDQEATAARADLLANEHAAIALRVVRLGMPDLEPVKALLSALGV